MRCSYFGVALALALTGSAWAQGVVPILNGNWPIAFKGKLTSLTSNYTFQANDSGVVFYNASANNTLTFQPANYKIGWNVTIVAGFEANLAFNTYSVGLSGNPKNITLAAIGVSAITLWFDGSNFEVISASPDIYQAYNAVTGNGAQIVSPLTVTGAADGTVNGTNIALNGGVAAGDPTEIISWSSIGSTVNYGTPIIIGASTPGGTTLTGQTTFQGSIEITGATLAAGGSGYAVGDTVGILSPNALSLSPSAPFTATVSTISGNGAIETFTNNASTASNYVTTAPINPVISFSTSGNGTGASFNVTYANPANSLFIDPDNAQIGNNNGVTVGIGAQQYGVMPAAATLATNPPASGTAYTWSGPGTLSLACPVTFNQTASASATAALDIGINHVTMLQIAYDSEPAASVTGAVHSEKAEIPAGWLWSLTTSNATIGTCVAMVH